MTRVLGLVEGDPATAMSAVPRYLLDALDRRLEVVDRLDYSPHGAARLAVAAATFRPSRDLWRARYHTSRLAHRLQSRTLASRLAALDRGFDVALQVHGWVHGQPDPYALYVDQTRLMAERGWARWMPFSPGERSELLELERTMYGHAAHLFVMGRPARKSLIADYGVDEARITVVGGGLSFAAPPPPGEIAAEPTILFIGRDFERKGGEVLLRAFSEIRREVAGATLHIVGARKRYEAPGVVGHGKIGSRDRLAELFRATRAFCLPSLYEPYGLVLIEAMAHGVPCVGTTVEAIPEILDDGRAGMLVPPKDPEALAAALVALLRDDDRARALGAAGRAWVSRSLTWDAVASRIAPALADVAD